MMSENYKLTIIRHYENQKKDLGFVDAHCHLADERIADNLQQEIDDAHLAGVSHHISTALSRDEFDWHMKNQTEKISWCAGIHPNYEKSDAKDFDLLIRFCDENLLIGIGEIGLDGRNENFEWQKKILLQQLELATSYELPVIFHVVHKYYDLYKILKNNFPKIRGFLHAFNSSQEVAENFAKFNLAFSIGCNPPPKDVLRFIFNRGLLLLETDAPFQKAKDSTEEYNHLKNLGIAAENIQKTCNCSKKQLQVVQNKTLDMLFEEKLIRME